jgi:hypothetical protein
MLLSEITSPRLFLCTRAPQTAGSVIELDGHHSPLPAHIESALDAQRPEEMTPRSKSIPLHASPSGAKFVYLVDPIGLGTHHTGWLKVMADTDPSQPGVLAHCAENYWDGVACPQACAEPWEYRAKAVRILKRIGRSAYERTATWATPTDSPTRTT